MVDLVSELLMEDLWAGRFQKVRSLQESRKASQRWNVYRWRKIRETRNLRNLSSVQSLSHVRFFVTPWSAACQASLSITNSQSLLKLMSITLVMPSNHLILCCPLLLPPSIFPSIKVFSNESVQVAKVLEFQLQHQSFQ